MPILSPLSVKLIVISISVLSAAVALKLSGPAISDPAVIYNAVVSWLKPPYLYLVINCIIVTIVASSKLQSKANKVAPSPEVVRVHRQLVQPVPVVVPHIELIKPNNNLDVISDRDVVSRNDAVTAEVVDFGYNNNFNELYHFEDDKILENDKEFISVNNNAMVESLVAPEVELEMNGYKNELGISKSSCSPPITPPISRKDSLEFSVSSEKPPLSARFGHRKAVRASPEGGKVALGVSKRKRQDTLENTWKKITEGRAMPLTRHLRKSETWETHGGRHHPPANQKIVKSETLNDGGRSQLTSSSSSPGSGKMKKERSLSQDDLTKRVEAFIEKFNVEMRFQRQESFNEYTEMISKGARE